MIPKCNFLGLQNNKALKLKSLKVSFTPTPCLSALCAVLCSVAAWLGFLPCRPLEPPLTFLPSTKRKIKARGLKRTETHISNGKRGFPRQKPLQHSTARCSPDNIGRRLGCWKFTLSSHRRQSSMTPLRGVLLFVSSLSAPLGAKQREGCRQQKPTAPPVFRLSLSYFSCKDKCIKLLVSSPWWLLWHDDGPK